MPVALPNKITPSRFHVPVGLTGEVPASHSVSAAPPARSKRFNFPPAAKAMDLLSGDQVGKFPPSVPGSSLDSEESNGRSQSALEPALALAVNSTYLPSGETPNPT